MFHTLIASDLDGTLLMPPNNNIVPPALYPVIRRLMDKGVLFCAASGRSYESLRCMFDPIGDDIAYMAQNGAILYCRSRHMATIAMPRPLCAELVAELSARDDCIARVNTDKAVYFITPDADFCRRMHGSEYPNALNIASFEEAEGNITQITATSPGAIGPIAAELLPRWEKRIDAAVTGEHWLDFTASDKGKGLHALCGSLGIPLENTIVFGDNYNDVPMLEIAGRPYIMENACGELLKRYPLHCRDVVKTLQALEPEL